MEIIDWTVKKYDVLNTRYIFNYIEYVTKLLEKETMSHTIDKTQVPDSLLDHMQQKENIKQLLINTLSNSSAIQQFITRLEQKKFV